MPEDFRLLDKKNGNKVFEKCLGHFVKSGNRRWWWEDFKNYSFSVSNLEKPFEHLEEYIPELERNVWLMVEDDSEGFYPIYDCNPRVIKSVIGECFGFEYYIISKDMTWLLCENHHSILIGSGSFENLQNRRV